MNSYEDDAGNYQPDDQAERIARLNRAFAEAARRATRIGESVDPVDVYHEVMIDGGDIGVSPVGVRGRILRTDADDLLLPYEGRVDVESDPLPEIDPDEDGQTFALFDEAEQWYLFASLFHAADEPSGGFHCFDLPLRIEDGLRTLFLEREEDLAAAGLVAADQVRICRRLNHQLVREALVVTRIDPLLAWAPRRVNEAVQHIHEKPISRFQRILLGELISFALGLPSDERAVKAAENLLQAADAHQDEMSEAEEAGPHDTPLRRVMSIIVDADLNGHHRWGTVTDEILQLAGRTVSGATDYRAELREAVFAAVVNETAFGLAPLAETLALHLGFPKDRVKVVVRRVEQEVLPHIR